MGPTVGPGSQTGPCARLAVYLLRGEGLRSRHGNPLEDSGDTRVEVTWGCRTVRSHANAAGGATRGPEWHLSAVFDLDHCNNGGLDKEICIAVRRAGRLRRRTLASYSAPLADLMALAHSEPGDEPVRALC